VARLAFGRDERWLAPALDARAGRLAWFFLEPDEHGPRSWAEPCSTRSTKGVNSVLIVPSPTLVTRAKIIRARSTR
jgi:hypothetical protein